MRVKASEEGVTNAACVETAGQKELAAARIFIRLRRKRGVGRVRAKRFGSFKGAEVGGGSLEGSLEARALREALLMRVAFECQWGGSSTMRWYRGCFKSFRFEARGALPKVPQGRESVHSERLQVVVSRL